MKSTGMGKSILAFPTDYSVVDIETTGLSRTHDSILEISALYYAQGSLVDSYHSLIKPPGGYVPNFITGLTGITSSMVKDAPSIEEVLPGFSSFVGDSIVLGWNVAFDVGFLHENLLRHEGRGMTNDYVDVMRIALHVHPELRSHKQTDVARFYGISARGAHRAEADCLICNSCYEALKKDILSKGYTLEDYARACSHTGAKAVLPTDPTSKDPTHPLYEKVCVFDGTLWHMSTKDAMQKLADIGGIPADYITKKTNYLVVGSYSSRDVLFGKSAKQDKARLYCEKGCEIRVITEGEFLELLKKR